MHPSINVEQDNPNLIVIVLLKSRMKITKARALISHLFAVFVIGVPAWLVASGAMIVAWDLHELEYDIIDLIIMAVYTYVMYSPIYSIAAILLYVPNILVAPDKALYINVIVFAVIFVVLYVEFDISIYSALSIFVGYAFYFVFMLFSYKSKH